MFKQRISKNITSNKPFETIDNESKFPWISVQFLADGHCKRNCPNSSLINYIDSNDDYILRNNKEIRGFLRF